MILAAPGEVDVIQETGSVRVVEDGLGRLRNRNIRPADAHLGVVDAYMDGANRQARRDALRVQFQPQQIEPIGVDPERSTRTNAARDRGGPEDPRTGERGNDEVVSGGLAPQHDFVSRERNLSAVARKDVAGMQRKIAVGDHAVAD